MPLSKWYLEKVVYGGIIHLDEGLTTIGRNHHSTIVASSDYVSRNHAQIFITPGSTEIHITDLGSKNGIYINQFHYCNAGTALNAEDRIGIGVEVEDSLISNFPEGKYPIFLLKRLPEEQIVENPPEIRVEAEENNDEIVQPHCNGLDKEDANDDKVDERNNQAERNDNFVVPEPPCVNQLVAEVVVKEEAEFVGPSSSSAVSKNINSIFGDFNADVLNTLSEETRKIAESSTIRVISDDVICISSSEDEDCDRINKQKTIPKSPEVINDSVKNDKHRPESSIPNENEGKKSEGSSTSNEANKESKQNEMEVQKAKQVVVQENKLSDNCSTSANSNQQIEKHIPADSNSVLDNNQAGKDTDLDLFKEELDDDEDDLFFTQKIFEDMKEYATDLIRDESPDLKVEPEDSETAPSIKQEIFTENLDGTIIELDDDDDLDNDLEKKVLKWSKILSKQSFSNSFNASQVYDDNFSDEELVPTRTSLFIIDDDDDDDEMARVPITEVKIEKDINTVTESAPSSLKSIEKHKLPEKTLRLLSTSEEDEEPTNDSDLRPKTKSPTCLNKYHEKDVRKETKDDHNRRTLTPTATYNNLYEEIILEDKNRDKKKNDNQTASTASLQTFHEKVIRRLSTTDEVPSKKARTSKRPDDTDTELIRPSSSTCRTYSRKNSAKKRSYSSPEKEDISSKEHLFEKLKEKEKSEHLPKSSSSSSSNQKNVEVLKIFKNDSNKETSSPVYKSATMAKIKSNKSKGPIDENDTKDFVEIKNHKADQIKPMEENKRPDVQVSKTIRGPPEIIQPPNLPTNKGKLRGISATHKRIAEKLKSVTDKKDLKRKWLEKPSTKTDKERAKAIQEDRKKKLKELNTKGQSENNNNGSNKVLSNETTSEINRKKLKVKVTENNRGAFLTEIPTINTKKQYTIPKKQKIQNGSSSNLANPVSKTTSVISPTTDVAPKKAQEQRKPSTEVANNFEKELAQADLVLQRKTSRDRLKSTETSNEHKQCAPPRRNSKKVNFASMKAYNEETQRILAKVSCLKSPISKPRKIRKVTFKLTPEIYYIESIQSAKPKRFQKESSTFMERKSNIRTRYPILDKTESVLDDVLVWSQLWLRNKQHSVNIMDFPMPNHFKSFEEYKSIVLPLLKMEFIGLLEQYMQQNGSKPSIIAEIDYSAPHNHRDYLFAKCNAYIKPSELSFNDLALIELNIGPTTNQYFGFISNIRRNGTCNLITMEITANIVSKEILSMKPTIKIKRVIDGIRMHLGTFNAVYQLEETPLIQKILNPIELLNNNNNYRLSNVEYKGFHELNKEQKDILLKTYERAIDQLNPNVSLINGPPGTGKSLLISNLAVQLLYGNEVNELDKKILICAQSNMAVDVIAEKLIKIKQKLSPESAHFSVVRYGLEEKVHPNVRGITIKSLLQRHRMNILHKQANEINGQAYNEESLALEIVQLESRIKEMERQKYQDVRQEELIEMRKNLVLKKNIANQSFRPEDERRLTKWFLENANIVCSTLSGCIKLANFVDYFDVCIIDEATQCTEPWTIMPLKFGISNLIMVGDTQQLPATVLSQSAKELGLEISLFTRIKKCLENNYLESTISDECPNKPIFTLHEQYRMHSQISLWPNMYFYKNQLINNPRTDEFKSSIKPFSILNLEYRQNDTYYGQVSGQISNNLEAEFVAKLVCTLDNYIPNKFYSYGVITPYAHHREKLENMIRNSGLKNIFVNTIDSYQGIEKDVIIISNARTHGIGFLGNYQRLNVALTRPRKCLILCGNFKNLESVPSWASLIANAKERGLYHNISAHEASDITKNVIEKIKIKR